MSEGHARFCEYFWGTKRSSYVTTLIHPSAQREADAVEVFVRRHQAVVWRYLRLLGCTPDTADDLTQDTFLISLRKGVAREEHAHARAWLRRVARNLWVDRNRRFRRRREVEWADQVDLVWTADESEAEARLGALQLCLDGLDNRSAEVVRLRYRENRSRAEIARELGMRENGVKTLIQRVRRGLRECVERRLTER